MKKVLVIGESEDTEIASLLSHLSNQSIPYHHWNLQLWPGIEPIELGISNERGLNFEILDTPSDSIGAIYTRTFWNFDPKNRLFKEELDASPRTTLRRLDEYNGLFFSLLRTFERAGIPVINPTGCWELNSQKPWQLFTFMAAGIPIPETLITNDPMKILNFADRHNEVIYKPIAGRAHAELLTAHDREPERLALLSPTPVLFQECIRGTNLRIYVLDSKVIAAGKIITKEPIDYRKSSHSVDRCTLSAALERAAIAAARSCGLIFAGVDAIETSSGFKILEANPCPSFSGFDTLSNSSVGVSLADFLSQQSAGTGTTKAFDPPTENGETT